MPLQPDIALAVKPLTIQAPDLTTTLLTAQQLRNLMQEQELRQMQMSELAQHQRQGQALDAYLASLGTTPPVAPTGPLGTPPVAPGEAPAPMRQTAPLATQAPTGTTFTRAPQSMQPVGMPAPVAPRTFDWREAYRVGGRQAEPLVQSMQQAQLGGMKLEQGQYDTAMKRMEVFDQALGGITDQRTLDMQRQRMRTQGLAEADLLPEVYDKKTIDQLRMNMVPMKNQLAHMAGGLTPIWGKDAQGNTVPLQATQIGELRPYKLPEGVTPLPPTHPLNLGTTQAILGPGGQVQQVLPKDVYGEAYQRGSGEATGKFQGKQPEQAREAYASLSQLELRHPMAIKTIDQAIQMASAPGVPKTGLAAWLTSGTPGTPQYDLAATLKTIGGSIGLEELQKLKGSGTSLTPVSDKDLAILQSAVGNIDQMQSGEQLVAHLKMIKQYMEDSRQERWKIWNRDYKQLLESPTQRSPLKGEAPKSPYSHVPVEQLTPQQMDEEEAWLKSHLGNR